MEEQIKQAVEIAISGTPDLQLKQQAIQFLNDLKSSPDGWQAFQLLLSTVKNTDQVRFIALQALSDYIPTLSEDSNLIIRNSLLGYLQSLITENQYDQAFLKNKLAECFASLFCSNYLNTWNSFFKDFAKLIETGSEIAIDQYLRIILAIHSEIGDQLIIRERPLVERNNRLKDAIRINDMTDLTLLWKKILNDFKDKNTNLKSEILKNTLEIIGGYVSWIEISLIVGDDYINLILQFLSAEEQKITTADTLAEIVSKKMKPENKLQLLSLLNLTNLLNSLEANSDVGFIEHVAKLYNAIGLELSYILDSNEASNDLKSAANEQIIQLFPFILILLSHNYDDVSSTVFPFLSAFLTALKKLQKQNSGSITSTHLEILNTLFTKIVIKMKFDEDDDGDDEDTIEEFNEFRAKLKVFQDTIGAINSEIYLEQLYSIINQSIFESTGNDWRQIELGLFELTSFSEGLKTNVLNIPKLQLLTSKSYLIFQELLLKTINSNVIQINHPLIQLSFFELIVRHYTLMNNSTNKNDLANHVLGLFTSPLGLYNSNDKVKIRTWYLFFRFVKLTKPTLSEDLLQTLVRDLSSSLLIIEAEVPRSDDESSEGSDKFDSQLYLFEALGLLVSLVINSKMPSKLELLEQLLLPIFNGLQAVITLKEQTPQTTLQAHHFLMAIGTIARGFEYDQSPNKKYSPEIIDKFNNVAEVVLVTLENLTNFENVRDSARFAFARFIPILSESSNINSYLSRLISQILASNNLKISELTDFLSFIGQIVHNFNSNDLIYQLLNDLFTPLTTKVYQVIEDEGENQVYEMMPDIQREKASLKRGFINLLINLTTNHVSSLLITQTNKATLPVILNNLFQESTDLKDPSIMKLALSSLGLLTKVFGNDKVNDEKDKFGQGLTIEGISTYLLENLVGLSFKIPFNNTDSTSKFDIKDAQFRFVLDELATLLIVLKEIQPEHLTNYLKEYFISIQLPTQHADDFIRNLLGLDGKAFKRYYTNFIIQFK